MLQYDDNGLTLEQENAWVTFASATSPRAKWFAYVLHGE
jgi:hypothetical protein